MTWLKPRTGSPACAASAEADGLGELRRAFLAHCDETGNLQKGTATAGVVRQYTGTATAIVAMYRTCATFTGH